MSNPKTRKVDGRDDRELWDFRNLMREIATPGRDKRTYFGDDTLRTLTLFEKALDGVAPSKK